MSAFAEEPSPGTVVAEAEPRPRRRWLRFSLRTLMVAVTLFCLAVGVFGSKAMRQKRAVERIKAAVPKALAVLYDFQYDEKLSPRPVDGAPPGPDWLRNLIGVDYFATVASVQVNVANDDLLAAVAELPELRSLRIACNSKISDQAWEHLKELTGLESLYLRGVHDSGMKNVSGLSRLRTLSLWSTDVSDAGLANLKGLSQLRNLQLGQTKVTESGVKDLQRALPDCKIQYDP